MGIIWFSGDYDCDGEDDCDDEDDVVCDDVGDDEADDADKGQNLNAFSQTKSKIVSKCAQRPVELWVGFPLSKVSHILPVPSWTQLLN